MESIQAIVYFDDNSCVLVSPAPNAYQDGESGEQYLARTLPIIHPTLKGFKFITVDNPPPGAIEEWEYNPSTDSIDTIPSSSVDWVSLADALASINGVNKNALAFYYIQLATAVLDQDEEFIVNIYNTLKLDQGVDQQLIDAVQNKLETAGVDLTPF